MSSESDEESGGRWSSSTEERGDGGGRGAASGAARTEGGVSLRTQEGRYPLGGTPAGQVGGGSFGVGFEVLDSKPVFVGLPSAGEVGGLWKKGQRLVGRGVGREKRSDDGVLSRLRAGEWRCGRPSKLRGGGAGGSLSFRLCGEGVCVYLCMRSGIIRIRWIRLMRDAEWKYEIALGIFLRKL